MLTHRSTSLERLHTYYVGCIALALFVITGVLAFGEQRNLFFNDDLVIYSAIAHLWDLGELPYRDIADHKPPLIYLFIRWCCLFGGVEAVSIWQGFTILTGVAALAVLIGCSVNGKWVMGCSIAFAYATLFFTDPLHFGNGIFANTELLASSLLMLSFAAVWMYQSHLRKGWVCVAGICYGLAVLAKQPSFMFGLPLALQIVLAHRKLTLRESVHGTASSGFLFALGCMVPIGAFLSWYWLHGALNDFIFWVYTANMKFASIGLGGMNLRRYHLENNLTFLWSHLLSVPQAPYLFAVCLVPFLLIVRRSWLDVVVVMWVVASVLATALNMASGDCHLLAFFLAPLAIVVGSMAEALAAGVNRCWKGQLAHTLVGTLFIFAPLYREFPLLRASLARSIATEAPTGIAYHDRLYGPLIENLHSFMKAGDEILYLGHNPLIFFYGNFKSASQFIYPIPDSVIPAGEKEKYTLDVIRTKKPAVIIVQHYSESLYSPLGEGLSHELGRELQANYVLLPDVAAGVTFKRRG